MLWSTKDCILMSHQNTVPSAAQVIPLFEYWPKLAAGALLRERAEFGLEGCDAWKENLLNGGKP